MIHFGQYLDGRSFGHRLDARIKIGAVVLLSILILQARGWEIGLFSGFLVAVCLVSRLTFSLLFAAFRPLIWFALLLFSLHLFFTEGAPLFRIPYLSVTITEQGLYQGFLVSWQFLAMAMGGAVLTMTTSPSDLIHGLDHLLGPLRRLRLPAQEIAVMVSMALRFIPALLEEYDRIRSAQMARGAEVETGRFDRRLKSLAALMIPLMVSAFRRADELAEAMEARGYAQGPRTTLNHLRFGREEAIAVVVLGLLFSVTLVSRAAL